MKNAMQSFSLPHGVNTLTLSVQIEYEHDMLHRISTTQIDTQNESIQNTQEKKSPLDDFAKNVYVQLAEYFMGQRTQFDIPLNPLGTPFQRSIWKALTQIPYGETSSYKDIARAIGNEKACRAVGMANNKNPIGIIIPCHRVIGTNGKLVGYASGLSMKSALLDLEKHVALHKISI